MGFSFTFLRKLTIPPYFNFVTYIILKKIFTQARER